MNVSERSTSKVGLDIVPNRSARKSAPYTGAQADILSDAALATAREAISAWSGYAPTPLIALPGLAAELGVASLHIKDEGGRFGLGSFKALGGAYAVAALLCREIARRTGEPAPPIEALAEPRFRSIIAGITVACATDGNHGRSVAWGAQRFGCGCVIFIHATVSEGRKAAIERYGARVVRTKGNYDNSVREAAREADENGWFIVSDTSYPGYTDVPRYVMQGYELMAWEACEALGTPPTHIILQTGVGGMAAAVAAQAKRRWGDARPTIVLADPDRSACWVESFRAGTPTAVEGDLDTVMAGLACGEVSLLAWEIMKDHADVAVAVTDEAALAGMRRLADPVPGDPAIVAGESATAGLAVLTAAMADPSARDALGLDANSRVLLFATEADTDPALYAEIVGRSGADVVA